MTLENLLYIFYLQTTLRQSKINYTRFKN